MVSEIDNTAVIDGAASTEPVVISTEGQETPTQPVSDVTPEQIEKWLTSKSHDELKKIPAYNTVVQKGAAKARLEAIDSAKKELAEQSQRDNEMSQWSNYFEQLKQNPAQLAEALKDRNVYQMYGRVLEHQGNGVANDRRKHAEEIISTLRKALSEDEELAALSSGEDWEELMQSKSIPELIKAIAKKGAQHMMNDTVKEEIKKAKSEFEAQVNELRAEFRGGTPEPTSVAGSPGVPVINKSLAKELDDFNEGRTSNNADLAKKLGLNLSFKK